MDPLPFLLFGTDFWTKVLNLEELANQGTISPDDVNLFHMVDSAEEGWAIIAHHYGL